MVRIEMARDMKLPKKVRRSCIRNKAEGKENEKVRAILSGEFGIQNPTGDDVQKYQMWKECGRYARTPRR